MKTYHPAFTEDQAEAVGFALHRALAPLKDSTDQIDKDLAGRLRDAIHALDTCPETEEAAAQSAAQSADERAPVGDYQGSHATQHEAAAHCSRLIGGGIYQEQDGRWHVWSTSNPATR